MQDSDPIRFMTYVVSGLQKVESTLGVTALSFLQSPQPPGMDLILTSLINDIASSSVEMVLVLDDYHLVTSKEVHDILEFLLKHLPLHIRLVISSRADPPLSLARLRSKHQLNEFRAVDLGFSRDETTEYFNKIKTLDLSPEDISRIVSRTEGWITGLQLAALSMNNRDNISSFIQTFTGNDRHIVDYLAEEVLHLQPSHIQKFLLQTSILDRLSEDLCDVVTGEPGSQNILTDLESTGLFIVPLDNQRQWYRYHHLFAELLRQMLQTTTPSIESSEVTIDALHIRASTWYEDQGFEIEALHHAAKANDLDRAERLIHAQGSPMYLRGDAIAILNWLKSLETDTLNKRPSLWLLYAWAQVFSGKNSNIEPQLQSAEAALHASGPEAGFQDLEGQIASIRGLSALNFHDTETMVSQSTLALELVDPENICVRTASTFALAYAHQLLGDLSSAKASHLEVISMGKSMGDNIYSVGAAISLGQISEKELQLKAAFGHYQFALKKIGEIPQLMACEAHMGLARVHYQWNDTVSALQHGEQANELGKQIETGDTVVTHGMFMTHVKMGEMDFSGAAASLNAADKYAAKLNFIHVLPRLAGLRSLLYIRQGKLDEADNILSSQDLPLSTVRLRLNQGETSSAKSLLASTRKQLEEIQLKDSLLEVLILQTLIEDALDQNEKAQKVLLEALELAKPGGFIRIFIDEGNALIKIMEALQNSVPPDLEEYVKQILRAFKLQKVTPKETRSEEHLSQREQEVLEYIAAGLSNQKITEALFVSMSTIKTHLRNIYAKLEVHSRTEAVARAKELGLL